MPPRARGRGRGGGNPLAQPFQPTPQQEPPTSPDDLQMDDHPHTPLPATRAPESSDEEEYNTMATLSTMQEDLNTMLQKYATLRDMFKAMEQHLLIVQQRHIEDIKEMKDQIATLATQVLQLQSQNQNAPPPPPAPTNPTSKPLLPPTWAQRAARSLPAKPPTNLPNKESTSSVLTKRDRTIVIERDGTPLPDTTNPLTIRNSINTAIKKPLIATIEFTTNHHVLLLTKDNTPASSVLKNHRSVIEETIRATIPAAIGLRKDEIWNKVILHGIPTTTTFTTVQTEVEEFNPGIHLPRPPRWLTTETQRQDKAASAMVLTIAGKDSTDKALSRGLSLFGRRFKVQRYLSFGPDTQCTKCLAFGHHPSQCTGNTTCSICAREHPAHSHTCSRTDCPTKGKPCLHTTIICSNCGDDHQATSKECPTYLRANQAAIERRNRAT